MGNIPKLLNILYFNVFAILKSPYSSLTLITEQALAHYNLLSHKQEKVNIMSHSWVCFVKLLKLIYFCAEINYPFVLYYQRSM